jgi:hypothetical protein
MGTPSVLSVMDLPRYLDWVLQTKQQFGADFPNFTLNILRFPSFQSVLVLPKHMRDQAADGLDAWLTKNDFKYHLHDMELDHIRRLRDYLRTVDSPHAGASDRQMLESDLRLFLQQYDVRRGKSLVLSCPEIAEWLYV